MLNKLTAMCAAAILLAAPAFAESWTLDGSASRLAFGSVKKDVIGEVHSFTGLSGTVADGTANIDIDLGSVETNIDIRNERMVEHVFANAATATLVAELDMDALNALPVGDTTVMEVDATLGFLGQELELYTEMLIARLGDDKVMVTTNDMLYVEVEDLGVTPGIDKLMELADLPGITRTVPVTLRFVFSLDDQKAEAAPAAPALTNITFVQADGDAKNGRKVFRKCQSCHQLKEGRNGAGPSLYNILGQPAGAVDGFAYSDALTQSGLTWDAETLATFLTDPKKAVPGNKMGFRGLRKAEDIADLIAYLAAQ